MSRPVVMVHLPVPDADLRAIAGRARAAASAGVDALVIEDGPVEAGILAAALAPGVPGTGVVPVLATEHSAPYHAARALATLDHLGHGWSGWLTSCPTGDTAALAATGRPAAPEAEQRARAGEFAAVLRDLWDSFTDDAFTRDRDSGRYFRTDHLRAPEHVGPHFRVAGPLNIARPPQGHPVHFHRVAGPADADLARAADIAVLAPGVDPVGAALVLREVNGGPVTGAGVVVRDFDLALALAADLTARFGPRPAAQTLRGRLGLPRPPARTTPLKETTK